MRVVAELIGSLVLLGIFFYGMKSVIEIMERWNGSGNDNGPPAGDQPDKPVP